MRCTFIVAVVLSLVSWAHAAQAQIVFPDGSIQNTAPPDYANTTFVPASGTSTENGTALRNAVAAISSIRHEIHLEAGVYDVGATPLVLSGNIAIRGASLLTTWIIGSGSSTLRTTGAGSIDLRNLHVSNVGLGSAVIDIHGAQVFAFASLLDHTGQGGATNTVVNVEDSERGFFWDCELSALSIGPQNAVIIRGGNSSLVDIRNCHFFTGGGQTTNVCLSFASTNSIISNAELNGSGPGSVGIHVDTSALPSIRVEGSVLKGSSTAVDLNDVSGVLLATSMLSGTRSGITNAKIVYCYDGSGAPIANSSSEVPARGPSVKAEFGQAQPIAVQN